MHHDLDHIASLIAARQTENTRLMVAIAGAPASGKSTLSERLHHHLGGDEAGAVVVPMDGFHFDDAILAERDLLARKGARKPLTLAVSNAFLMPFVPIMMMFMYRCLIAIWNCRADRHAASCKIIASCLSKAIIFCWANRRGISWPVCLT